jgi:hypothetical protein
MIVDADCRVALEPEGAEARQLSRNGETGTPTPLPRLRHSKEPRCFRFGFSGLGPGRCDHLEPLAMSSVSEMPTLVAVGAGELRKLCVELMGPPPPKVVRPRVGVVPRKFCEKLIAAIPTRPGRRLSGHQTEVDLVDQ